MIHIVFISNNFRLYDNAFLSDLFEKISLGDSLLFFLILDNTNMMHSNDFKVASFLLFLESFENPHIKGYVYEGSKKDLFCELKEELLNSEKITYYDNDEKLFLFPIDSVLPMKVFTPFFKKMVTFHVVPAPTKRVDQEKINKINTHINFKLKRIKVFNKSDCNNYAHFPLGEKETQNAWNYFKKNKLREYVNKRDFIDECNTSRLSAAINSGVISVRQLWHESITEVGSVIAEKFLSELGWREFAYHVAHYNSHIEKHNLQKNITHHYLGSQSFLKAWKTGKTGFLIVDAAMNQLNQEGWIPNRARMIVASFLVKNLHCDWREGTAYFMEKLVDGDNVINAFNWQWVSGVGYDSAPYFRIFNPELQAKKFDSEGEYVAQWNVYHGEKIIDYKKSREIFLKQVIIK